MLKPTASTDSWECPWNARVRKNRFHKVPQNQSGKSVAEISFILCFLGVIMLSSSLVLIGVSIWSLVRKIWYRYLLDIRVDIPYFSLPAAFILLPGFWIATSIHNKENRSRVAHLLLVIIILSSGLLITGSVIGLMYAIHLNPNTTKMYSSMENEDLNKSVSFSFLKYNTSEMDRYAWDKIQRQLKCCGISNYSDWNAIGLEIPNSCCVNGTCTSENAFLRSCLDSISRDLVWQQNVLKSHCYIMTVTQTVNGIVSFGFYITNKLHNKA